MSIKKPYRRRTKRHTSYRTLHPRAPLARLGMDYVKMKLAGNIKTPKGRGSQIVLDWDSPEIPR
jgi:hypothetical protein